MGSAIHEFKIPQIIYSLYIAYNMKSMNSSAHEHVHCRQTTKFHAHEIKRFHNDTDHGWLVELSLLFNTNSIILQWSVH